MENTVEIFWGPKQQLIYFDLINNKNEQKFFSYEKEEIPIKEETLQKAKYTSKQLGITLEAILAVKIIEALLKVKTKKIKQENPDCIVIDIYDLSLNSYILNYDKVKLKIVTPYEKINKKIDFL